MECLLEELAAGPVPDLVHQLISLYENEAPAGSTRWSACQERPPVRVSRENSWPIEPRELRKYLMFERPAVRARDVVASAAFLGRTIRPLFYLIRERSSSNSINLVYLAQSSLIISSCQIVMGWQVSKEKWCILELCVCGSCQGGEN